MNNTVSNFIKAKIKLIENLEGRYVGDLNLLTLATFSMSVNECTMTTRQITIEEEIKFNEYFKQFTSTDVPTAYIVGFELFLGNKIFVNQNTLIPRFETEELVYNLVSKIRTKYPINSTIDVLDVCTGSGVIAISIALLLEDEYNINLTVVDLSPEALDVCRINLEHHKLKATVINSDMTTEVNDKYDVVVSNPPYIDISELVQSQVLKYEPHLALYAEDNGLLLYKQLIDDLKRISKLDSILMLEIGKDQAEALNEYLKIKWNMEFEVVQDMNGLDRNLYLEANWNIH